MAKQKLLVASEVITAICRELKYSRSHVAKIMRTNAPQLEARRRGRTWQLPARTVPHLKRLIKLQSGPRYKLGERGPHL